MFGESKRIFAASFLAALALTALDGCASTAKQPSETLRIGYQKWGPFSILKVSGKLAEAFKAKGMVVVTHPDLALRRIISHALR